MMTKETSFAIRAIGFLCSLMIIPIHCPSVTSEWLRGDGNVSWTVALIQFVGSDTIVCLAVPWFFVMSGFFLVKGVENGVFSWWRNSLSKRLLTLGIPYLVWNLIYYLFKLCTGKFGFSLPHCLDQLIGFNLFETPACGQFWYVRCLLIYVLFAPVFYWIVRSVGVGICFLAFLLIGWFRGFSLPFPYVQPLDFGYLFYFVTGLFLAFHGNRFSWRVLDAKLFKCTLSIVFISLCGGVVVCALKRDMESFCFFNHLMILSGLVWLWSIRQIIVRCLRPMEALFSLSFFIYAVHILPIGIINKVLYRLSDGLYDTVGYGVKILFSLGVSLCLGWCLQRWSPKVLALLSGGRCGKQN